MVQMASILGGGVVETADIHRVAGLCQPTYVHRICVCVLGACAEAYRVCCVVLPVGLKHVYKLSCCSFAGPTRLFVCRQPLCVGAGSIHTQEACHLCCDCRCNSRPQVCMGLVVSLTGCILLLPLLLNSPCIYIYIVLHHDPRV